MKKLNWNEIEETEYADKLPAGGYVCRIVAVEDVPEKEYLWITYDIAEGEYAGKYSDDWGKDNPWAHRFVRSYKDSAAGMFKGFVNRIEESNKGFVWDQVNESQFVGKEIGLVFQTELYTNTKGDDKERLNVFRVVAAQDIRVGDFKVPEPVDNRETAPQADTVPVDAYDDVPFV